MACVVCKGKRKEPGLGVGRSIDQAFRKIEKVEVGVLRETEEERESDQAGRAGPEVGAGLVLWRVCPVLSSVSWRSERTLNREGSWVDLSLESHSYYHLGVGLARY